MRDGGHSCQDDDSGAQFRATAVVTAASSPHGVITVGVCAQPAEPATSPQTQQQQQQQQ